MQSISHSIDISNPLEYTQKIDTSPAGIIALRNRGLLKFENTTLTFADVIADLVDDATLSAILQYAPYKADYEQITHFDFARYKNLGAASIGTVLEHCSNLSPASLSLLHYERMKYCDLTLRFCGQNIPVNLGFIKARCPGLATCFDLAVATATIMKKPDPLTHIVELELPSITAKELRLALATMTGAIDHSAESEWAHSARLAFVAGLLGAHTLVTECDNQLSALIARALKGENGAEVFDEIKEALDGRLITVPKACRAIGEALPSFFAALLHTKLAEQGLDKETLSAEELAQGETLIHKTFELTAPFGHQALLEPSCMLSLIEAIPNKELRSALFKYLFNNVRDADDLLAAHVSKPFGRIMPFLDHFGQMIEEGIVRPLPKVCKAVRELVENTGLRWLKTQAATAGFDMYKIHSSAEEVAQGLSFLNRACHTLRPYGIKLIRLIFDLNKISQPFDESCEQHVWRNEQATQEYTKFVEAYCQQNPYCGNWGIWLSALYRAGSEKNKDLKAKTFMESKFQDRGLDYRSIRELQLAMADLLMTGGEGVAPDPQQAMTSVEPVLRDIKDEPNGFFGNNYSKAVAFLLHKAGRSDEALALLTDTNNMMMALFIRKLRGEQFTTADLPPKPPFGVCNELLWDLMSNVVTGEFPKTVHSAEQKQGNDRLQRHLFSEKATPIKSSLYKEVLSHYPEKAKELYLTTFPDLQYLLIT